MVAVWLVLGAIVGGIVTHAIFYIRARAGTLKIDHSNPEKDVYRFDIDDIDALAKKRVIVLKVDNKADLSPK